MYFLGQVKAYAKYPNQFRVGLDTNFRQY